MLCWRFLSEETKNIPDEETVIFQEVAPRKIRREILKQVHNHKTASHLGVTKTLYNVRQRFYWPGNRADIRRWCHCCKECNIRKPKVGPKKSPLKQKIVGMPWEWIAMDIMGPLPKSNSGNLYILVIGDYFTKWTESNALKDHTAQTIADVLVNQWICRFGVPRIIHTDQGRDFESNLIHEMCHLLDIEKTRTCPYRPQSDGMVGRFNSDPSPDVGDFRQRTQR